MASMGQGDSSSSFHCGNTVTHLLEREPLPLPCRALNTSRRSTQDWTRYKGTSFLFTSEASIFRHLILHMLLLSWVGDRMPERPYAEEQQESLKRLLLAHGVSHNDMRDRNMLWNEERGAAMLIDFDCATMQPPAKHRQISLVKGKDERAILGFPGARQFPPRGFGIKDNRGRVSRKKAAKRGG